MAHRFMCLVFLLMFCLAVLVRCVHLGNLLIGRCNFIRQFRLAVLELRHGGVGRLELGREVGDMRAELLILFYEGQQLL